MYLHKTKNENYTPPCCYFSGELEVVEGIWYYGRWKLTTECIENVIMMVPFSAVVIWNNRRIDVLCGDEGKKVSVKMYEIVIY